MIISDKKRPIRFALIVFIGITVFCLAQLSWWIIFNLRTSKIEANLEKQLYMERNGQTNIPDTVLQDIQSRYRRHVIMFVSESSFFTLVILFGAFLIYRTLRQSEALKKQQQNMIHAVTHEFRTPITSLRLYLEMLQAGDIPDEKATRLFPKMIDDTNRLEHLVDNVLQAGHFSRDTYQLNLKETDFSSDIEEYVSKNERYITQNSGKIKKQIEPGILAKTDYASFGRAINALIDNALKYNEHSEKAIEITLTQIHDKTVLTITDNGIGIEPNEQKRIFDRFYRGADTGMRTINGTGLGLYLVREIVEAHGGTISVTSAGKGKGATFIITLPVVNA